MQPIAPGQSHPRIPGPMEGKGVVPTGHVRLAPAAEPRPAPPTPQEIADAVARANEALRSVSSSVEFSLDSATGKTVIRVIDSASKQVIRQLPSEEMLAIARAVDRIQGLLLQQDA